MASYFDERNVEENEETNDRIQRLTRETFRMILDQDPYRYGNIVHSQITPPASKSEIEKLKITSQDDLLGEQCPICLSSYQLDQKALTMPCDHIFHDECLKEWLNKKKILASRESLLDDNSVVSETDNIDTMAQEYLADIGPGALIELHQHMVRSPPPTTWPRIPIFKYEEKDQIQELYGDRCKSPQGRSFFHSSCSSASSSCVVSPRYNHQFRCHRSASESRDREKGSISSLFNPSSLLSLTDMCRSQNRSSEENQKLV